MTHPCNGSEEDEETSSNDSLLVDNVQLLRDGGGKKSRTKDDGTSLGNEVRRRGEVVDDL